MMKKLPLALLVPLLASCSTFDMQGSLTKVNAEPGVVTAGKVDVVVTDEQQKAREQRAAELLQESLSEDAAVELMLSRSPAFQELLLNHWQAGASVAQTGRIANPVFSFERMVKGEETEYGRFLRFGLLDVLTLPARQAAAEIAIDRAAMSLSAEVYASISQVRLAWLDAVTAEAKLKIAEKAFTGTSASADLAKRMKQTGNFTTTDRIRQQLIFSEATIALATARQERIAAREKLVRLLGLEGEDAQQLKLPTKLPKLAKQPLALTDIAKEINQRFDVRMARLDYESALKRNGVDQVSTFTDIEYGRRYDTINDAGSISHKKGYELEVKLPVFDWGDMQRDALQANLLAKQQAYKNAVLSAASQLRESYSLYRTSFDVAQHYQNQILPMQETLLEEATYNYNGMIIGVFELMQAGRDMAAAQQSAIDAKRNVLNAEIAMNSVVMGRPIDASTTKISASSASADAGH